MEQERHPWPPLTGSEAEEDAQNSEHGRHHGHDTDDYQVTVHQEHGIVGTEVLLSRTEAYHG